MKKQFVLSSSHFDSKADAERRVNGWWHSDNLKTENVKMYRVVETYDLQLKFIKRKDKK